MKFGMSKYLLIPEWKTKFQLQRQQSSYLRLMLVKTIIVILHYLKNCMKQMSACLQNYHVVINLRMKSSVLFIYLFIFSQKCLLKRLSIIYWNYLLYITVLFKKMQNIFSSVYILLNKVCLFGGTINCLWSWFNVISSEQFVILISNVEALSRAYSRK